MTTAKTMVISLASAADIITEIVGETDTTYLLKHPYELLVDTSSGEFQSVSFAKYLPYNTDGLVAISKSAVVALAICSERFNGIYERKVKAYEELNANTDLDNQAMLQEAADAAMNDEDEEDDDSDDYDPSEASPVRVSKTIH